MDCISATDQCGAGDRSLHRERPKPFRNGVGRMSAALLKREPTRRSEHRHFNLSHAGTTIRVCVSGVPEETPHRRPSSRAWLSDDCCLSLRSKTAPAYRTARRDELGNCPEGSDLQEAGYSSSRPKAEPASRYPSEEAQMRPGPVDTGHSARERAVDRALRRIGVPEASHASATMCL